MLQGIALSEMPQIRWKSHSMRSTSVIVKGARANDDVTICLDSKLGDCENEWLKKRNLPIKLKRKLLRRRALLPRLTLRGSLLLKRSPRRLQRRCRAPRLRVQLNLRLLSCMTKFAAVLMSSTVHAVASMVRTKQTGIALSPKCARSTKHSSHAPSIDGR